MSRLRIAHLSDPHFGTILPGVREGLLATLRTLRPDLILLSGDITQRARGAQFREAREFVQALDGIPMIALPGNHDLPLFNLPGRLLLPYREYRTGFSAQLEGDYLHGDVRVTGLNSTSIWRHVQGDFRLDRVETRLREGAQGAQVHIAAFHHPMDCKNPVDEANLLKGREGAMALFDRHGVDLIVGGHIHDPHVALSRARYPGVRRNLILTVAGTCLSSRTRKGAPNSFNWIEVETPRDSAATIRIARMDQGKDLRFAQVESHRFARDAHRCWSRA